MLKSLLKQLLTCGMIGESELIYPREIAIKEPLTYSSKVSTYEIIFGQ
jgi:hypothetical protein